MAVTREAVETGLTDPEWPARLELFELSGNRRVLMDAAHNIDGATALADYLKQSHDRPALVFGWGRAVNTPAGRLDVVYTRRLFDDPVPGDDLRIPGDGLRVGPLGAQHLAKLKSAAGVPASVTSWLVSIDLPIEAETRGEAVRQFWSYVRELGPRELPTFVAPLRDELAMQAYVLGEQANLDPEEDS